MAGFSLSLDVRELDAAVNFLGSLTPRQIEDLATMAGVELVKVSREAFASEIDPVDGSSWEATASKRRGGSILRDTSRLMRSVKHEALGSSVYVGSHLVYARIHQEGGRAGRGGSVKIPRRRYLGFKKSWPERFMKTPEARRLFT